MKIVSVQEMRDLEARAEARGLTFDILMENAGKASALEIERAYRPLSGKKILILIGPGNNGGDGLVAARYLADFGAEAIVVLGSARKQPDKNLQLVQEKKIPVIEAWKSFQELEKHLPSANIAIDALFGTGKARAMEGIYKQIMGKAREQKSRNPSLQIVALDLPSGMDADTGSVDSSTCPANFTVTMAYPKKGFFAFPGAEYLGKLDIVDIGIPDELAEDIKIELLTQEWARSHLPYRPIGAHKGTFGKLMVVAGSERYFGAPYLACAGAYRAGAGLVTLASIKKVIEVVSIKSAETTYLPLPETQEGFISSRALEIVLENLEGCNALLIGPGIGKNPETRKFLYSLLSSPAASTLAVVLDADALNLIGEHIIRWQESPSSRVILTPHPAEFSRMSGLGIAEIQKDRIEISKEYAARWKKVIVLKGAFTVIAEPEGPVLVSPWATPALATAGTGDVLAGIISSFFAQGLEAFPSAALGVYIHGLAGELVGKELGKAGAIASDLLPKIPLAIKRINQDSTTTA